MTTYSPAKSVLRYYYLELYPYPLEPDIPKVTTEFICREVEQILEQYDCTLHHICIGKRKVGLYLQAPLEATLSSLVDELVSLRAENLPKWDKHFNLYSVGLPYRLFKKATASQENKFTYIG